MAPEIAKICEEKAFTCFARAENSPKYIVFLVGAGISRDSPSNLPLGPKLSRAILVAATDEEFAKEIEKLYCELSEASSRSSFPIPLFGSFLRLEAVMSNLQTVIGGEALCCLDFMRRTKPNCSHFVLGQLALQGSTVLTTNFDELIEESVGYDGGESKVLHLHGKVTDPESMKATIERVTEPLDPALVSELFGVVKDKKMFVAAGYSAGDRFDVIPALLDSSKSVNAEILWIQHRTGNSVKELNLNVQNFLQAWPGRTSVVSTETGVFLSKIGASLGLRPYARKGTCNKKENWWEELLGRLLEKLDAKDRFLVKLSVLSYLGVGKKGEHFLRGASVALQSLSVKESFLFNRLRGNIFRNSGDYATCLRECKMRVIKAVAGLRLSDFLEDLVQLCEEVRNYGQRDTWLYALSFPLGQFARLVDFLFRACNAAYRTKARVIAIIAGKAPKRQFLLREQTSFIRRYRAQFWRVVARWIADKRPSLTGRVYHRLAAWIEKFAKEVATSIERSGNQLGVRSNVGPNVWLRSDLRMLSRGSKEVQEVLKDMHSMESMLSMVNALRRLVEIQFKNNGFSPELLTEAEVAKRVSEILGDPPGILKAYRLMAMLAAEQYVKLGLGQVEEVRWSGRTKQWWRKTLAAMGVDQNNF